MKYYWKKKRKRFELGGRLKVKVLSADIILRRIDLGLAEEE